MKVIIAGSRSVDEYSVVVDAIEESPFEITEVVSGGADGVDTFGERWAHENSVPLCTFDVTEEAYDEFGKGAPLRRNEAMSEYADALIAVWDQESSGTKHMISTAESEGLDIHVEHVGGVSLDDF